MKERQFDDFNQFATDYRSIHNQNIALSGQTSEYFAEYKIKELARIIENKDIKILDFGCGDGISAEFFRKYFPNAHYTGIDISEDSIGVAKQRALPQSNFMTFDGSKIPFEAHSFDLIFTSCVFHHIAPSFHLSLLTQIKDLLTPNGRFVIFEHNPFNPITLKIVNDCVFDKDAILINPFEMKSKFSSAGFSKISTTFTLFFPRKYFFNRILFLEKFLSFIPFGGQYYTIGRK
jgi:SAM-dependent methyltransferase